MARMKLHKNTRFGDYEVYPIYDIDFTNLSSTGYVQEESNDAVGSQAYKYRQWKTINNNIGLYIPRNIPKVETQEGNIIPFWHRYNNIVDGRYTLDTDNLSSYATVEQGIRPDDWGTNPNYINLEYISVSSHNIIRPNTNKLTSSWSSSASYYEDTKRTILRMFYTDTGNSFTVGKHTVSVTGNYYYARAYSVGTYPHPNTSTRIGAHYSYTDNNGSVLNGDYYIQDGLAVNPVSTSEYQSWSTYPDGYNNQMVFVHYVQDGTDFYGVAIIQMNNFTEQSEPVAIHVSAWDASFWGTSIVAGGGGSGPWTNDGPISYVQGGTGNFDAPSDNRGDQTGTTVINIVSQWGANYSALCASGYHKYNLGFDSTAGIDDSAAFEQFMSNLWNPGIFTRFVNFVMNPIDSILSCHLIPKKLSPPFATSEAGKDKIVAANVELTPDYTVSKFHDLVNTYHLGSVDIKNFSDSFADYTNTAIYVHLPYIGTKQIDVNACMGGWISVDYAVEYLTGDCIAFITTCDKEGHTFLRYSFKGNCAKTVPVKQTGGNLVGAALTVATVAGTAALATAKAGAAAAGAIIPAIATPLREGVPLGYAVKETIGQLSELEIGSSVATATKGLASGIATSSLSSLISSSQITSSNAEGGAVTAPCDTVCYVVIQRPMWSAPEEYGKQFGYPSDIGGTINQSDTEVGDPFTNFLAVRSIKLDGISATDEEKSEIESLMTAGVYVSNDE